MTSTMASSQNASYMKTDHEEDLHQHDHVECASTLTINPRSSQSDLQYSQIDYSISALSAFNGTGDDRIHRLELCSVETQTDFPSKPPKPPQSKSRASRVNLKSKHLALSKFKQTKRSTVSNMIASMLLQSNLRGRGCCYWHVGLQSLLEYMVQLLTKPCDVSLHPYSAWQCQHCLALHDDTDTSFCDVCFCDVCDVQDENLSEGIRSGDLVSSGNANISSQSKDSMGHASL